MYHLAPVRERIGRKEKIMRNSEFACLKDLCRDQRTVKEDLQYRAYLFLHLTERQGYMIAEILKETGFPVVEDSRSVSGKAVELPNGLRLHLNK